MAEQKISALRRAVLLTMAKATMPKRQIRRTQKDLNKCLKNGLEVDFKKAAMIGNSLPRHLHKEIVGRYVGNLQNGAE